MLSVTQLAERCGISRATLLHYEKEGLLLPATRGANGYRWYGEEEHSRLQRIVGYRQFGMSLAQIAALLDTGSSAEHTEILQRQFLNLAQQIQALRQQQQAIAALLKQNDLLEENMISKERWVAIMQATGFTEEDMRNWHINFEKMEPDEHQRFLESLGIAEAEIKTIRGF